jgi:nucleoid-associated protein YgaU
MAQVPPKETAKRAAPARSAQPKKAAGRAGRRAYRRRGGACENPGGEVSLPGWYVVRSGDTLWAIAERHYGAGWRYRRIWAANRRRLWSAHRIYPCQRVYLPAAVGRA